MAATFQSLKETNFGFGQWKRNHRCVIFKIADGPKIYNKKRSLCFKEIDRRMTFEFIKSF